MLLHPEMYTIGVGVDWADSYKPQLEGVREFLLSEGLRPTQIYAMGKVNPVWHLRLTRIYDLLVAFPRIAPLVIKKRDQVEAAIFYLKDEITGEQLVEAFNEAVRVGTRSGYIRSIEMPFTHSEGVLKGKENLGAGPFAQRRISGGVLANVKVRKESGTTLQDIARAANVSRSSLHRARAKERERDDNED